MQVDDPLRRILFPQKSGLGFTDADDSGRPVDTIAPPAAKNIEQPAQRNCSPQGSKHLALFRFRNVETSFVKTQDVGNVPFPGRPERDSGQSSRRVDMQQIVVRRRQVAVKGETDRIAAAPVEGGLRLR